MADSGDDDGAFWLPSDFLTDDDFKEKPSPHGGAAPDHLLAELTRHLAHSMTLNAAGRRPSTAGAWAASHQACNGYPAGTYNGSPPAPFERRAPPVCYGGSQSSQFVQSSGGACRAAASVAAPQSVWPLRPQPQGSRLSHACAGGCYGGRGGGGFVGGSGSAGVKRQSTGTGVFLPRRVGNIPAPEPRKKQGFSTVLLPARVVQALNLNVQDHPLFLTNHDLLLARRNAMLAQQRRLRRAEGQIGHHEVPLLPQEWTY